MKFIADLWGLWLSSWWSGKFTPNQQVTGCTQDLGTRLCEFEISYHSKPLLTFVLVLPAFILAVFTEFEVEGSLGPRPKTNPNFGPRPPKLFPVLVSEPKPTLRSKPTPAQSWSQSNPQTRTNPCLGPRSKPTPVLVPDPNQSQSWSQTQNQPHCRSLTLEVIYTLEEVWEWD